ncbi:hypothetical protein HKD37_11G030160 [Glycine soja]
MTDCSLPSFLSGNYGESVDLGEICLGLLQQQRSIQNVASKFLWCRAICLKEQIRGRLLSLSCQTWRMERLEALVDVFNVGSQRGGNSRQVWSSSDPHLSFP